MAAAEILLSAPTQNTPKLALLPISGLGSGCACTQQSWILQQDGVMQDHVPWVQKGAIKGMHGGGGDPAQRLQFVGTGCQPW